MQGRDALQLASQMGNVAFTALARTLARQPDGDTITFPPDHIYAGGAGQGPTVGPDGILEFPPDYIGPGDEGSTGETIEFPPDHITSESSGAGAAGGSVG